MRTATEQLDKRFKKMRPFLSLAAKPSRGWIRAIREALGFTTTQFAKRLNVKQPRVIILERAEIEGKLTLETLERAAAALECRLVYALVPQRPLTSILESRALKVADRYLASVDQTMRLEAQQVKSSARRRRLKQEVKERLMKRPSRLWNEPD